jgi:hypothetical protein
MNLREIGWDTMNWCHNISNSGDVALVVLNYKVLVLLLKCYSVMRSHRKMRQVLTLSH